MLNHIDLMGRLTRDPELRYTQTNTPVATFRLAVDRDKSKEKKTDFIEIVAWRNTAEFVGKYIKKGRLVVVSGSLQMREWQDKEGNKRITAEVICDSVYPADSKEREEKTAEVKERFAEIEDEDSELPF